VRLIGERRSASLSRREADLAVRLSRPTEKRLVVRKIGTIAFSLYAAPGYLAAHEPGSFEFIGYDESLDDVPQQRWLKAAAGARPIVLRTNDIDSQRAAARTGVGIAALPCYLGDSDSELAPLDVRMKSVTRDVWLVVHGDLRRAPPVRAVMAFLVSCFACPVSCARDPSRPVR
jgi:DNA-binding transcriptional LysR family regulator